MAKMRITPAQASQLLGFRDLKRANKLSEYKANKKSLMSAIKREHGISSSTRLVIDIVDSTRENYLVIRDKRTRRALDNGLPEPVQAQLPTAAAADPAPASLPQAAPIAQADMPAATEPAKKAPAKKAAAKAPAKKAAAKPAAKTPAKKAAAKPAGKTVARGKFSKAKTADCTIEVRTTIDGKRTRIGYVNTDDMKAKVLANVTAYAK